MAGGGIRFEGYTEAELLERKKSKREDQLKEKYAQLNSIQLQALSVIGARVWLLQGPQLVRKGILVPDLFFKISSFLIDVPADDAQHVFNSVNKRLFNDIVKNIGVFHLPKKIKSERKDAKERCEIRMKF
jgi:hypothetical protein